MLGRTVLLVERFDRADEGGRILAVSALTMTDLDELQARSGSYVDFLDAMRANGAPGGTATELYTRIAFNMAISNSDDHLRNHAALWDGRTPVLSPAYDLSPIRRSGETASALGHVEHAIRDHWEEAAEFGRLTRSDRDLLWGRQFLNPGTLYGFGGH